MKDKKSDKIAEEFTPNMIMKYEIAEEQGLIDKIKRLGWGGLTAKETGRIGGIMTAKKKRGSRGK
ncbi:MAG: small, acid-soluble spore protein, alpha/beta type [Candidatus Alkaliphilus sp. MAG34]